MDFITYNERLSYLLEKIEKGALYSPQQMRQKIFYVTLLKYSA